MQGHLTDNSATSLRRFSRALWEAFWEDLPRDTSLRFFWDVSGKSDKDGGQIKTAPESWNKIF